MSVQGERMMKIETLLEGIAAQLARAERERGELRADIKKLDADLKADAAQLAAIKHKGGGLLLGVGLLGGGVGAWLHNLFPGLMK